MSDEATCPICGRGLKAGEPTVTGEADVPPAVVGGQPGRVEVTVHEVCALRVTVQQLQGEALQVRGYLGSVLAKLGGSVRIHQTDVQRAAAVGCDFSVAEEPGGWATLELRRVALVKS